MNAEEAVNNLHDTSNEITRIKQLIENNWKKTDIIMESYEQEIDSLKQQLFKRRLFVHPALLLLFCIVYFILGKCI